MPTLRRFCACRHSVLSPSREPAKPLEPSLAHIACRSAALSCQRRMSSIRCRMPPSRPSHVASPDPSSRPSPREPVADARASPPARTIAVRRLLARLRHHSPARSIARRRRRVVSSPPSAALPIAPRSPMPRRLLQRPYAPSRHFRRRRRLSLCAALRRHMPCARDQRALITYRPSVAVRPPPCCVAVAINLAAPPPYKPSPCAHCFPPLLPPSFPSLSVRVALLEACCLGPQSPLLACASSPAPSRASTRRASPSTQPSVGEPSLPATARRSARFGREREEAKR